jgi:hypothetical protein
MLPPQAERAGEGRPGSAKLTMPVLISVADTGEGMSEEVLARACEPFYTTKEPGKGSGLGLAQVYGLARQSGGGLRIKSAVGQGTTVEVYLPRSLVQGAAVTGGWDSEPPRAFGGRATVLVVDDQEDVREVTVAHLEALGIKSFRPPVVAPRSTFWGATALVSSW